MGKINFTTREEFENKIAEANKEATLSDETIVLYGAMDEMFNMLVDTMEMNAMLMMEVEALKAEQEIKP